MNIQSMIAHLLPKQGVILLYPILSPRTHVYQTRLWRHCLVSAMMNRLLQSSTQRQVPPSLFVIQGIILKATQQIIYLPRLSYFVVIRGYKCGNSHPSIKLMSKLLLLALIATVVLSGSILNIKYRDVLNGKRDLKDLEARRMYLQHEGTYPKDEYRFGIFLNTLKEIIAHNKGKHTWVQGINEFSDVTFAEFSALKLMAPQDCSATKNDFKVSSEKLGVGIPDAYEWNNFGVVTPVKNQGSCGSCWTFSTVGSMEAHWNILGKGKNVIFAEQQLVDCAGDFDNHGCQGGLPSHAFEYIKHRGALELGSTYPYTAKNGDCVYNASRGVGYVKYGSYNITAGDEVELADRLYNVGPVAVSFKVVNGFKNYAGGVYSNEDCGTGPMDVNHAVLATGYGVEGGQAFWNIKNSWGNAWGSAGYFKILRGKNMCAIAQCNAFPLIDHQ